MIKLLKNVKPVYWLLILLVIALVFVQVFCDLSMPDYLQNILKEAMQIQISTDSALIDLAKQNIMHEGLKMFYISLITVASAVLVAFLASKIAAHFAYQLRKVVYKKVETFSMNEIDKFSTSSLITRSTNDITQVQMVTVMVLRMAVAAPIYSIYGIIKACQIEGSEELSFITVISIIALCVMVIGLFLIVLPKFNKIQTLTDKLNLVTRENLTGLRVVRASNAQELEREKFKEANNNITKNNIFVDRILSLFSPGLSMLMNFTSLAILWVGSLLTFKNPLALPSVFTFQQYTMMIVMGFMQLTMIMIMVPRGVVSGRRINEILKTDSSIINPQVSQDFTEEGTIEFKNVSFSYGSSEEPVLNDISFKVNKGETLAIIGGTGCGKSTLVNLMMRLFDASEGTVLVDGVNVKEVSEQQLRDKIGFVPQKANLFSGTIRSNLAFGKPNLTDEDIKWAVDVAQSNEFVNKIGYDALVAQGGTNFSGGQKQRLCIARAIIKRPEILIFDDSFSALDLKTDKALRDKLKEEVKNSTQVIVAQRISTIINADKIIVLDDGKIVGYGKHKDLLENCEVYKEIAYSQMSKEEL